MFPRQIFLRGAIDLVLFIQDVFGTLLACGLANETEILGENHYVKEILASLHRYLFSIEYASVPRINNVMKQPNNVMGRLD